MATGVARRLLVLFLLCTLVPLLVSTFLAYRHVTRQLIRQSEDQLTHAAKAAGTSVVARLLAAEAELERFRRSEHMPSVAAPSPPELLSAVLVGEPGSIPTRVVGEHRGPLPRLSEDERALVEAGRTRLITEATQPVFLVHRASGGGLLWGAVRSDQLWSNAEIYAGSDGEGLLCVRDSKGLSLSCPLSHPAALGPPSGDTDVTSLRWEGTRLTVASTPLYLPDRLASAAWSVSVGAPAAIALAPVRGFTQVFLPTILLVLWTALLLVKVQIRRTLGPLERLREGTLRVSGGDFSTHVDVRTDDEFRDLADSFNTMSKQLGRQFRTLEAIHELDRVALQAPALDALLTALRAPLRYAVPDAEFRILLLLDEGPVLLRPKGLDEWESTPIALPTAVPHALRVCGDHALVRPETDRLLYGVLRADSTDVEPLEVFPMLVGDEVAGALVARGPNGTTLSSEEVAQLRPLADQIVLGAASVRRQQQLVALKEGALRALALTIDASSRWTAGHSARVSEVSTLLAAEMGMSESEITLIRESSLLHDIGKIGVPTAILNKPAALTEEERLQVERHVVLGAEILQPIEVFAPMLPVVRHHHERVDGGGYPDGLRGRDIPLIVRVVTVADAFDALISERPYRNGIGCDRACEIIKAESGTQFDARVVAALLRVQQTRLPELLRDLDQASRLVSLEGLNSTAWSQ